MSRLIDADALSKEFDKRCYGDCCCCLENTNTESGCKIIDEAPTVDAVPVVHGHWRRGKSYPHNIYCSNCYRTYVPDDELEMWKDWTRLPRKYCPECGAKMDEVTE